MTCEYCDKLGLAIDEQNERITDLHRDNEALRRSCGEWQEREKLLLTALDVSTVRLGICLDSFMACHENHPGEHAVRREEVPAWIVEARDLLDRLKPPDAKEQGRRFVRTILADPGVNPNLKRQAREVYEAQWGEDIDGVPVQKNPDRSKTRSA
jgi:hypothetical protein